jgi:MFS family permease
MSAVRWMAPLCVVSVLWAFSFGVNAPLASVWMQTKGCSDTLIGLNTGVYYLGIAVAAIFVPWAMRRWGCAALFMGVSASAVTSAAFPWSGGVPDWFALRGLNGMAGALSLIPLETFVNRQSSEDRRATHFGYYAFCIALGMALGNVTALQMAPSQPRLAFLLGGASALAGAVVVALWRPIFPEAMEPINRRIPIRLGRDFLAFGSGWVQGFLEGGMVGLLSIYLLSVGLSHEAASWLMGGLMIGVILAQAPLAWLADRFGRVMVLAGCNGVALVGIGCLLWTAGVGWLAFWLFVVGACSGALYPLGLALIGERTPPEGMSRAGAWFLAVNCLGSLTGPVVTGAVMDWFGRGALFAAGGGAILAVFAGWAVSAVVCRERTTEAIEEPVRTKVAA